MRLPRVRFTIRRMMIVVAVVGFVVGGAIVIDREGRRSALRARVARLRALADQTGAPIIKANFAAMATRLEGSSGR